MQMDRVSIPICEDREDIGGATQMVSYLCIVRYLDKSCL